jgi:ABC-type transport system substrate-binding protein
LRIQVVTVDAATNPQLHAAAEQVVAAWKDFGIKATLKAFPPTEFVEGQLRSGDFDAAVVEMDLGLDPDLTALLDSGQAARGGSNIAGYQSAKMDGLLSAARTAIDATARKAKFAELQKELVERIRSCRCTSRTGSRWCTTASRDRRHASSRVRRTGFGMC